MDAKWAAYVIWAADNKKAADPKAFAAWD